MRSPSPIFLLTDFGTHDPYAAQMKAVILQHVPDAVIIDYSHHIRPFDVMQAGFFLWSGYRYLPQGSVMVCVVDPGVGTRRQILLVAYKGKVIIAPDNGLTGLLVPEDGRGVRVFAAHRDQAPRSSTFHGRDVFAPLAAQVIGNTPLEALGKEIAPSSLVRCHWALSARQDQQIVTHVLHVDVFGNCLLGLGIQEWASVVKQAETMVVHPGRRDVIPVTTYAHLEKNQMGIVAGSQGVYELCLREASAAKALDVAPGSRVTLEVVRVA